MKANLLTSRTNYFESFEVGQCIKHARGKTVEPIESVMICNMVLNTAAVHFDEHLCATTPFKRRVLFGGITAAIVVGLASQDTSENALRELTLTGLRLKASVYNGDTLYAYTEVLSKSDGLDADSGIVTFKHWGVNQDDVLVMECQRSVLIKRISHWGDK
ncbi:(R)-specific enoyl-CoA hydratase RipB/Ich [soil metagenome]